MCSVAVGSVTVGTFRRSPCSLLCVLLACICGYVDVNMYAGFAVLDIHCRGSPTTPHTRYIRNTLQKKKFQPN
jgi:hypothetical protein